MDKNRPAKNELVLTKPKSYSVIENRDRIMAGTTRNCGEKTYKYSSISKLWALYKNDDPPSVEDEEEEDEQDEEEEDANDEDDDDAALFAHGTVGDAAAGDNDDELVDDPDDDVPLAQSLSLRQKSIYLVAEINLPYMKFFLPYSKTYDAKKLQPGFLGFCSLFRYCFLRSP